jgi:hypothetical protein
VEREKTAKPQRKQIFRFRWWGLGRRGKNKEVEEETNKEVPLYVLQYATFSVNIFHASDGVR